MCGDYQQPGNRRRRYKGSPPRVRGLQHINQIAKIGQRITPACAGTTREEHQHSSDAGDHPRVCGDYIFRYAETGTGVGSPPRVRGLRKIRLFLDSSAGITPACAGTTCIGIVLESLKWDHPRVCGDYFVMYAKTLIRSGSPPRVRGLRGSYELQAWFQGITPACAGTTLPLAHWRRACQNHPRVCGDYG